MSNQNRRSSFSSSTASSLAKRHAPSSENVGKPGSVPPPHLAKKRAPLGNLTNQRNVIGGPFSQSNMVSAHLLLEFFQLLVAFVYSSFPSSSIGEKGNGAMMHLLHLFGFKF